MADDKTARVAPTAPPSAELAAWAHTVLRHRINANDEHGQMVLTMLAGWAREGDAAYYADLEHSRLLNELSRASENLRMEQRIGAVYREESRAAQAVLNTIPPYELSLRQIMVEIEATGLLRKKWELDPTIQRSYDGWAAWRRRKGSGWLHIFPPDGGMNRGNDSFAVVAAFGGTRIDGVTGATATEALVNAINSLTEADR